MTSPKKDLLSLLELSTEEIQKVIDNAMVLKQNRLIADPQILKNKTGVLIFEKPSLRTRITFETAINELGGHTINLATEMVGMGKRESVADVARILDRVVHLIVARTFSHKTVEQLSKYSSIPVINALTDIFHPCQALAFAMTLSEHRKDLKKTKVVFIGDSNNVCNSLMVLCSKLGYDFTVVCPQKYSPKQEILTECLKLVQNTGSKIEITQDIKTAIKDASALYTDVWTSMGQENETEQRKKDFAMYQINADVLKHAPSDVLISHCLPAHRGEEITSDVLDSENSIAFDEAENRLHVQKAVIQHLFS
ncbi:MAG: ornithine carbamoyltransferase [Fibrobacter sp.]|nr:ornithine carbamoyltransferase [Fibrobacter sp.]